MQTARLGDETDALNELAACDGVEVAVKRAAVRKVAERLGIRFAATICNSAR